MDGRVGWAFLSLYPAGTFEQIHHETIGTVIAIIVGGRLGIVDKARMIGVREFRTYRIMGGSR
jgi:hypothetical protein